MVTAHRALGTWQKRITRYIALNEFCRDRFVAGGLPADRISVKPNFVALDAPTPQPRSGLLFVGRLSPEKGTATLADALRGGGLTEPVSIAGAGPDEAQLANAPGARLLGSVPPASVYAAMAGARALVLPSICYENFPRTLVEAFACGLPVIASRLGALATLVDDGVNGLHFEAGNAQDLRAKMRWCIDHPEGAAAMGRMARATYEARLTPAANLEVLTAIYERAMREHRHESASA